MATINLLSRLVNGVQRQVDLSTNTLWVQDLQLNNSSGYTLAGTTAGHAGSSLIGDDASYANFTPASATVKGALSGIDTALATAASSGANKTLSNLTSPTAINQSLLTATGGTQVLGSTTNYWGASFISQLKDTANFLSIDAFNRLLADSAGTTQLSWSTTGVEINSASLNMNSHTIINLANPVNPTDATNKSYVDNIAQGLNWKETVRTATTAALPTYTYASGVITASANGALPAQDGVTLVNGDRLLVKDETATNEPYNGIYVVTDIGSGTTPFVLTRSSDANTAASLQWATVEVSPEATTQAGYVYREALDITTLGTDNVSFDLVSKGLDWVFGNGFSVSGNNVAVLAADSSINVAALGIKVVEDAAGAIVTGVSGIKVQTDGITVGINGSNQLYVPNAGISATQLSTGAFDQATITGGAGTAAAVAYAPQVSFLGTAGQAFTANTTYAVRYGLVANGETAGRLYAADILTSSFDLFWVVGFIQPTATVSIGGSVKVIQSGTLTLLSSDTVFGANDPGKPIFLQSGGTNATTTAPSTSGDAVAKIGMVVTTSSFLAQIGAPYVA